MLDISDPAHQLKVPKDIVYQQMLLVEIINFKHETIVWFLKETRKRLE